MLWKIGFVGARIFHYEYSILSSRLCQDVCLLAFSVDVINLYSSRLDVALEVMILEGNMFRSRGELLRGSHRDARLIVFPNFAVEFWAYITVPP